MGIILRHLPIKVTFDDGEYVISQIKTLPDGDHFNVEIRVTPDQAAQIATALKKGHSTKRTPTSGSIEGFDRFWEAYPRHEAKAQARKAWTQKNCHVHAAEILSHVELSKVTDAWRRGYIPHAATYLNQRRWEDMEEAVDIFADAH